MIRPAALVVVIMLLVAGCSETSNGGPSTTATPAIAPTETGTGATETPVDPPTRTVNPSPTEIETPNPVKNPWGEEPIVIAIQSPNNTRVNYTKSVLRSVNYWKANNHTDLRYRPNFVVEPSERRAHILIRFVTSIDSCGESVTNETIGCAPILTADDRAASPEIVRVQKGLTNKSTYRVVRHELGHILGLQHGEGPAQVMSPSDLVHNRVVRVDFEFETTATAEQRETRRQARYAFRYYSDGAEGFMDEDVSFAVIDTREEADITIRVERQGGQSNAEVQNGRVVLRIQGIDVENRGWHIGYWLGFYFGAESIRDLPPAFDEPNADPRQQWW